MISPESCSLLNWALKDSMKPFWQGAASMNAVSTPAVLHHSSSAGGSEFRPVVTHDVGRSGAGFVDDVLQHRDHVRGLERPARNDGQRGARVFVDDVEGPDVPAAGGHVGLEVEADHMHRILGYEPFLLPGGPGAALLPRPGFTGQPFIAPEPAHALPVQHHAVPLGLGQQVPAGLPPAPGGVFPCDSTEGCPEMGFLEARGVRVATCAIVATYSFASCSGWKELDRTRLASTRTKEPGEVMRASGCTTSWLVPDRFGASVISLGRNRSSASSISLTSTFLAWSAPLLDDTRPAPRAGTGGRRTSPCLRRRPAGQKGSCPVLSSARRFSERIKLPASHLYR
ncbi:hypothetical protein SRABI83_03144 [Arthrobacter sp. Bi83]|nr:hypothetical protein SRABI83_03144 [Arthrobacter sp. Bi83]